MTRFVAALLIISLGATALADTGVPVSIAAVGERTAETLKQLEREWADAEEIGDCAKVDQIVADDWAGIENDGSRLTKEQLIARMNRGRVKSESVELGPMEVKLLGDVAIVQGSLIERSTTSGKYSGGELLWMDVFTKRDGKWVAVRSQSARANTPSRMHLPI